MGNNIFSKWVNSKYGDFESFISAVTERTQLVDRIWQVFYEKGPESFYSASIVNSPDKEGLDCLSVTEIISELLLTPIMDEEKRPIDFWREINSLRKKTYFTANHNETEYFHLYSDGKKCQYEQNLAKLLYLNDFIPRLGNIIDYQVPLREKKSDKIGAIDLVSYSENQRRFSLIELKYNPVGSSESLLRCVLEAYTYYKFWDKNRFIEDFKENYPDNLKGNASRRHRLNFDPNAKFELVILFGEGAKDIFKYINGADIPLLPLEIHCPTQVKPSRQFIEFTDIRDNLGKIHLYNLCKYIAGKEDILFRFCKLARSENGNNEKFEAVEFMEGKEKTIPVDFDWHIGQYYIQDQFIID
jgi:hypothetical protein